MLAIKTLLAMAVSLLCMDQVVGRVPVYNRVDTPKGWSMLHEATGSESMEVTLVFKQSPQQAEKMEKIFWSVSTPSSDEYGNFLSYDEVTELVRLNEKDRSKVLDSLLEHGIDQSMILNDHGDALRIKAPVSAFSSFFDTKFHHFVHSKTGRRTIKQVDQYSLPDEVADSVRMVFGVHTFPPVQQKWEMKQAMKQRRSFDKVRLASIKREDAVVPVYVPQSINALYGMPVLTPGSNLTVSAAPLEFSEEESFSPDDLNTFAKKVNIDIAQPSHIVGNNSASDAGTEAELDVQWLYGVNNALDPWFWIESSESAWIYTFTQDFLSAKEIPQILSVSYGLPETMQCSYFNPSDCNGLNTTDYIHLVDSQFQKIGLLGVSSIICSQDRGTYMGMDIARFQPEYPGTSPYVTSVGATETINSVYKINNPPPACSDQAGWSCVSGGTEAAVSYDIAGYLSGGGFSDADSRPDYQKSVVDAYLSSGVKLPPNTAYNSAGRGFPDVAAIGTNGYIIQGGESTLVGGTSMSTPIIAAVVALLQADYIAITGKPLGFLNPMIYEAAAENPALFTDITVGDNCQTAQCNGQQDGFLTTKGWDPVTGFGSPVVPEWRKYIQELAHKVVAKQSAKKQTKPTTKPAKQASKKQGPKKRSF